MADKSSQIRYPSSINELFNDWERFPDALVYSKGSSWLQKKTSKLFFLSDTVLCLDGIAELRRIDRTERYIELGSNVSLNRVVRLGKIVPEALTLALKSTMTFLLKNSTTVCSCLYHEDLPEPVIAAFTALDAKYELRTLNSTRWISASQFSAMSEIEKIFKPREFPTRIRIPLETWDYTYCRDFSAKESGSSGNEFAVFLARMQKNILSEVRLIFSGTTILRDRDSEISLIGSRLPLDKKTITNYIELWETRLKAIDNRSDFQKAKLLNFVDSAIHYFAY